MMDLLAPEDRTHGTIRLLMAAQAVETQLLVLKQAIAEVAPAIAAAERRATAGEKRAKRAEKKLAQLTGADVRLVEAAAAFLRCNDTLTTEEYALGADREEYYALRAVLEDLGAVEPKEITSEEDE